MVCTNDTGILLVATELAMCPPTWKNASGAVVAITRPVGYLNPPCNPGTARPTAGRNRASTLNSTHHPLTKENWIKVSVTGRGNALRMLFEDVLDSADARYLSPRPSQSARRYMAVGGCAGGRELRVG